MSPSVKEQFEPISEPMFPQASASYWTIFSLLEIGGFVAATPIVLAATWPIPYDIFIGYAIAAFWVTLLSLIFAGTQTSYLKRKLGRVDFDGETVTVFNDKGISLFSAELAECRWFSGNRSWATVPWGDAATPPCGFSNVCLIEFPEHFRTQERSNYNKTLDAEGPVIAAVGLTPETRRYWEDVFYRLGVNRNEEREMQPAPLSETFHVFLWGIAIIGTFFFAGFVTETIDNQLPRLGISNDIAFGIAFSFFVPGVVFFLILFASMPFMTRLNSEIRQAKSFPDRRLGYLGGYWMTSMIPLALCWGMEGEKNWTRQTSIAYATTTVLLAFVLTLISWSLLYKQKPKQLDNSTFD